MASKGYAFRDGKTDSASSPVTDARSQPNLLIVVPYRDRLHHLQTFIPHICDTLTKQGIRFRIAVVHQFDAKPFNRGLLLNIGFLLASKDATWVCFHDVDLLPEDSSCDYGEPTLPTHLAGCAQQYGYTLPYASYCGGAIMFPTQHFLEINGFSNRYWGWGREDDDLFVRLLRSGLHLERRYGRYASLPHAPSPRTGVSRNTALLRGMLDCVQGDSSTDEVLTHLHGVCRRSETIEEPPPQQEDDGLSDVAFTLLGRRRLMDVLTLRYSMSPDHEYVKISV